MLDINLVRENSEAIKASETKRGRDADIVDEVLKLDAQWRKVLKKVEALKHTRNVVSQEINEAKKAKNETEAKQKILEMKQVVTDIKKQEASVEKFLNKRNEALAQVGNVMHAKVPSGVDEKSNVELKQWGKKDMKFTPKNHVDLVEELGLADFESSAVTSGNGFYFLKNDLALMNQALIRFATDFMRSKGYNFIEPPLMIRKGVLGAAVDVKEFGDTIYSIEGEDLALIGTSEHALLGMHAGDAIVEKELPKKYFSYTMCFRKEVGAHGINEKGLWRTHQFNKVEQFVFCSPEQSEKVFQELLKNSEEILQALRLPYRVIEICAGDLSLWKNRSYDIEVWRPTIGKYGEIMSLSNCTDYQARKLDIKVDRAGGRVVMHTLNNTALATSRIMVGILENFQTSKGIVKVPKVLWPYMNGVTELK